MILDILKIYEITFLDLELFQVSTLPSVAMVQEEALLVDWEIETLLRKGWIKLSSSSQNQYISPVFFPSVSKKDAYYLPVLTLKRLNQHIPYVCCKMKGSFLLKELLQREKCMCKIDIKDAYFSVLLHKVTKKI